MREEKLTDADVEYTLKSAWKRARRTRAAATRAVKTGFANPQTFTYRMRGLPGWVLYPFDGMRVARIQ